MKWTRGLVIVYVNIALYACCFQMQRPIEPFLVEKLGAGETNLAVEYGKVQSFFGIIQTIGSFVFGLALDRVGAKAGFMLVFLSASASYGMLSMATSMTWLYLSKVPMVFLHAFLVAQLVISQDAAPEDRTKAFGYIMGSYTIGATVGPAVGGYLGASGNYYQGARCAAAGSLLSAVLTLFYKSKAQVAPGEAAVEKKAQGRGVAGGIADVLTNKAVVAVLATKLVSSVTNSIFHAAQPIVLKQQFGLHEAGMGYFMSTTMACNAVCGWFVVGFMRDKFDKGPLVFWCLLWMGCCYGIQVAFSPGSALLDTVLSVAPIHQAVPFMAVGVVGSMAAFMRSTVFTDISTSSVPDHLKGTLLGMEHGIFSFSGTLTPRIGTGIFAAVGLVGLGLTCSALEAANAIAWRFVTFPCIAAAMRLKEAPAERPKEGAKPTEGAGLADTDRLVDVPNEEAKRSVETAGAVRKRMASPAPARGGAAETS